MAVYICDDCPNQPCRLSFPGVDLDPPECCPWAHNRPDDEREANWRLVE